MNSDALLVVNFLFSSIWHIFTSFNIPGTRTTPAGWALFTLGSVLAIRVVKILLHVDFPSEEDD